MGVSFLLSLSLSLSFWVFSKNHQWINWPTDSWYQKINVPYTTWRESGMVVIAGSCYSNVIAYKPNTAIGLSQSRPWDQLVRITLHRLQSWQMKVNIVLTKYWDERAAGPSPSSPSGSVWAFALEHCIATINANAKVLHR